MAVRRLINVRMQYEAILIDLVRIIRNVSDSGSKGVLSHHVPLDVQRFALIGTDCRGKSGLRLILREERLLLL